MHEESASLASAELSHAIKASGAPLFGVAVNGAISRQIGALGGNRSEKSGRVELSISQVQLVHTWGPDQKQLSIEVHRVTPAVTGTGSEVDVRRTLLLWLKLVNGATISSLQAQDEWAALIKASGSDSSKLVDDAGWEETSVPIDAREVTITQASEASAWVGYTFETPGWCLSLMGVNCRASDVRLETLSDISGYEVPRHLEDLVTRR